MLDGIGSSLLDKQIEGWSAKVLFVALKCYILSVDRSSPNWINSFTYFKDKLSTFLVLTAHIKFSLWKFSNDTSRCFHMLNLFHATTQLLKPHSCQASSNKKMLLKNILTRIKKLLL